MRLVSVLIAMMLSWSVFAAPKPEAALALPDTPAGRYVGAWLAAYNSADLEQLERFRARYRRPTPAQVWLDTHAMTGRLQPVRVDEKGPNEITVLLSAQFGDRFWQQSASMDPADSTQVIGGGFRQTERPPEFAIPRVSHAELERMIGDRIARDVAADRFAGTIVVQRHGRTIHRQAAGLADRATKQPVTMETRFRIGSANKMFTAVAVLQLVERGRISLDATVGTYMEDYPNAEFARSVTIRQLLNHTGGAGDIFTPEYDAKRLEVRTVADYVTLLGTRPADASERGRNAYANYGYVLLGRIVEVVSGTDYYAYVRDHVFAPAGMRDTDSLPEETAVANRSRGYMRGTDGRLVDNADTLPWRGSPAGGGYSTAGDLVRFADALRAGRLLSKATLAMATSAQRPDGWYGFGFGLTGEGTTRSWGHSGGAPGMNAAFRVYPELDAVVVVLANVDPLAADDLADFYANRMALDE